MAKRATPVQVPTVKAALALLTGEIGVLCPSERLLAMTEMAFLALTKALSPDQDAVEAQYMAVVRRIGDDEARRAGHLFACVWGAVQAGHGDVLGTMAAESGLLSEHLGQFFTPREVCRLIARMTMAEAPELVARQGYISVCEPCVGAGAMVLAGWEFLRESGVSAEDAWFDCTDVSEHTAQMAYLQLAAAGVPGIVRCGDSLSLTTRWSMLLPEAGPFLLKHGAPWRRSGESEQAPVQVPTKTPTRSVSLFDMEEEMN